MKKIGIFLGVLFMGLLIFVRSPAPARAEAWTLPFSKLYDIVGLAETIFSGGKVNISDVLELVNPLSGITDIATDLSDRLSVYKQQSIEQSNAITNALINLGLDGYTNITSSSNCVVPIKYSDIGAFINFSEDWYYTLLEGNDPVVPEESITNVNVFSWPYSSYTAKVGVTYDFSFQTGNNNLTFHNAKYPAVLGRINENNGIIVGCDLTSSNSNVIVNLSHFSGDISSFNVLYPNLAVIPDAFYISNGVLYLTDIANDYLTNGVIGLNDGILIGPDVINLGDTGDTSYDVIGINQPDDLGLDIPNFIEWILSKVNQGVTSLSYDDLIADEAPVVKTIDGTRAINYDDTRPVERVIEITLDDPDPQPSPTPLPDDPTPPILKLPTFNYLPHNSETTVLSELIDATQKTVPEDLINLIWNCFGLLVVGGLIYILHK